MVVFAATKPKCIEKVRLEEEERLRLERSKSQQVVRKNVSTNPSSFPMSQHEEQKLDEENFRLKDLSEVEELFRQDEERFRSYNKGVYGKANIGNKCQRGGPLQLKKTQIGIKVANNPQDEEVNPQVEAAILLQNQADNSDEEDEVAPRSSSESEADNAASQQVQAHSTQDGETYKKMLAKNSHGMVWGRLFRNSIADLSEDGKSDQAVEDYQGKGGGSDDFDSDQEDARDQFLQKMKRTKTKIKVIGQVSRMMKMSRKPKKAQKSGSKDEKQGKTQEKDN